MKQIIMCCDQCGRQFEWYEEGEYDEHIHFLSRRNEFIDKTAGYCFNRICSNNVNNRGGLALLEKEEIQDRLSCFLTWDFIHKETKENVKAKVEELISEMDKAEECAINFMKDKAALDKKYIMRLCLFDGWNPTGDEDCRWCMDESE